MHSATNRRVQPKMTETLLCLFAVILREKIEICCHKMYNDNIKGK